MTVCRRRPDPSESVCGLHCLRIARVVAAVPEGPRDMEGSIDSAFHVATLRSKTDTLSSTGRLNMLINLALNPAFAAALRKVRKLK